MVWRKFVVPVKKIKVDPIILPQTELIPNELNVKAKTLDLKNIENMFITLENFFKKKRFSLTEIKNMCSSKDITEKMILTTEH